MNTPLLYQSTIDLSDPANPKGVTNLSYQPIVAVHSSSSPTDHVHHQPSTLDSYFNNQQRTPQSFLPQQRRPTLDPRLDLNLF